MSQQLAVFVGPPDLAAEYVQGLGLDDEGYMLVDNVEVLHGIDPTTIAEIVMVETHLMAEFAELVDELLTLQALWPEVPVAWADQTG